MSQLTLAILLLHVASTLAMVGLIWFVQVVHYPLFASVGEQQFVSYERQHMRFTTWVVAPLMLTELATAALLFFYHPTPISLWTVSLGAVLLAAVWLLTYFLQVPQHDSLSRGFDMAVWQNLVAGNWWRTAAWTARGLVVMTMLWQSLRGIA